MRDSEEVGSPVEGNGSVVCVGSIQLISYDNTPRIIILFYSNSKTNIVVRTFYIPWINEDVLIKFYRLY